MSRFHHYDNLNTARFITFSTYRRLPLLTDPTRIQVLLQNIDMTREKHSFRLLGYVVMPEHVHLVIHPQLDTKVGLLVREIKSRTARKIFAKEPAPVDGARRVFWTRRCYDHNCRTPEAVVEKIRYCHNNPVKRGLVRSPGDWPWSSWGDYHGESQGAVVVDTEDWYANVTAG